MLNSTNENSFRLPGYSGAALYLRMQDVPEREDGFKLKRAFDVGLLSPDRKVEYFSRSAALDFPERLAKFFWDGANELHPELCVPILSDVAMGFTIAIISSTDFKLEVQVTIVQDLNADILDFDGLNFETSRICMTKACTDMREMGFIEGDFISDDEFEA